MSRFREWDEYGFPVRQADRFFFARCQMKSKLCQCLSVVCAMLALTCERAASPDLSDKDSRPEIKSAAPSSSALRVEHAKGFTIERKDDHTILTILNPWDGYSVAQKYCLVRRGAARPSSAGKLRVIETPLERIAVTTTAHLPHLDALGVVDTLVGVQDDKYVSTASVRERLSSGKIRVLGGEQDLNHELVVALRPDIIVIEQLEGENKIVQALEKLNVCPVLAGEYMETDPLGRAEWIKFFAALYEKDDAAAKVFDGIRARYERLKRAAAETPRKPTVFCNDEFKGTWWMPGGKSFFATLLKDAGATYLWEDVGGVGTLKLDFEAVLERAGGADFWLNTGESRSRADLLAKNRLYAKFAAFRDERLYNNNARSRPNGGNDFWETGIVVPDEILADLIHIFHPEIDPGHVLKWYMKLPDGGAGQK